MQRRNFIAEDLPSRLWIALALVAGLLIGLLLAWQVFPVRVVDTDPSDLRARHQADYVAMVADSWTVTGNADLARERLYELVDKDTTWADVDALLSQTASDLAAEGNLPAALRLNRMQEAVPLPVVEEGTEQAPAAETSGESVAPAQEEALPADEQAEESEDSLGWLPIAGLLVVLAAAGTIGYIVLRDRRRLETPDAGDLDLSPIEPTMDDRRHGSAISLNPIPAPGGFDDQVIASDSDFLEASVDLQGEEEDGSNVALDAFAGDATTEVASDRVYEDDAYGDASGHVDADEDSEEMPLTQRPALEAEEAWHIETPAAEPMAPTASARPKPVEIAALDDEDLEIDEEPPTGEILTSRTWPRHAPAVEPALAPGQLGIFETSYSFGDDDFYHAFTIESPAHEFLGQCGIVISDTVGVDDAQMVDAFDIWLFETQGTRTLSKVIVSEQAFDDESISTKLIRKGELVVAQPGLVIELETESIRLTATVEDVAYRDDTAEARSVFDRLKVRMVVEQLS